MPHRSVQAPPDIKGLWPATKYVFYAYSFEVAAALLSIVYGVAMLLPGGAQAVPGLPAYILTGWGTGLTLGGVLTTVGLLMRSPKWEHLGRGLERAGLILLATSYLTVLLGALSMGSEYGSAAIQAIVLTIGCLGRLRALSKVEKVIRQAATNGGH